MSDVAAVDTPAPRLQPLLRDVLELAGLGAINPHRALALHRVARHPRWPAHRPRTLRPRQRPAGDAQPGRADRTDGDDDAARRATGGALPQEV